MKVKILKTGVAFARAGDGRTVAPAKDTIVEVGDELGQGLVAGGFVEEVSSSSAPDQPVEGQAAAPNATEAAVREAEERGVDLREVDGSGADGRITQSDVINHAKNRQASGPSETTAMSGPAETR